MVTASHNPPYDNGYKVYWGNAAQIIPPHDTGIAAAIDKIGRSDELAMPELEELRAKRRDAEARLDRSTNVSADGRIGMIQIATTFRATDAGPGADLVARLDAIGAGIAARGNEVGTTTGRPRRVGWFDAVPLRYAVAVNSISSIMLNKLDILSGIDPIRLCVAYDVEGRRVDAWPSSATVLARATPIYDEFDGWSEPIHDVRSLADLPENARRYVTALEEHAGVPIVLVSVGPERTQTIERAWRPMRRRPAIAPIGASA
jgi:hypothetical protein